MVSIAWSQQRPVILYLPRSRSCGRRRHFDHGRTPTGYRIDRWAYNAASNSWEWAFLTDVDDGTSYMPTTTPTTTTTKTLCPIRGISIASASRPATARWKRNRASGRNGSPVLPHMGQPTAPRDLTAEAASSNSIMLTWTAPESDNGRPITGYQLQRRAQALQLTSGTIPTWIRISRWDRRGTPTPTLWQEREYEYQIRATTTADGSPPGDQAAYSDASASATTVQAAFRLRRRPVTWGHTDRNL